MIVVDSSGWLEFLTDGPLANDFARRLRQPSSVLTPAIVVYEVYKHTRRLRGEEAAIDAVAAMRKTRIIPLTEEIALVAADLSLEHKLAMADAIVLATARLHDAEVITSDADFSGIAGAICIPKP